MKIQKIECFQGLFELKHPFQTSYGVLLYKPVAIYCVTDERGNQGFGELVALPYPDYIEETFQTAQVIIERFLVPLLTNQTIQHPKEIRKLFRVVRGNEMAKSALETAIWDLYAKRLGQSFSQLFSVKHKKIPVGVSIGIEADEYRLLKSVEEYLKKGYTRVKLKIKPGYDVRPVQVIRSHFPELALMVDANSAYSFSEKERLMELDQYGLVMIEQPFSADDFLEHSKLQKKMTTKICLDENIRSLEDVKLAHHLGSCRAINLKIARVGGIAESLDIVRYCQENHLMIWLGGMFETGIGRALNLSFAAQDAFGFPGDISASERYFFEDSIVETFSLEKGCLTVPSGNGIGVHPTLNKLNKEGSTKVLFQHKKD